MNNLQKQFETATGQASWINSDIYHDGKIYTKPYTEWLESLVMSNAHPVKPSNFTEKAVLAAMYAIWTKEVREGKTDLSFEEWLISPTSMSET